MKLTPNQVSHLQFVKDVGKAYQNSSVPEWSGKVVPSRDIAERLVEMGLLMKQSGWKPVKTKTGLTRQVEYKFYSITKEGETALFEIEENAKRQALVDSINPRKVTYEQIKHRFSNLDEILCSLKKETAQERGHKKQLVNRGKVIK